MKWLIRCDVEGVTGVVDPAQAAFTGSEFAFGQRMLMNDLNAVIEGLLRTEDPEIWLYDAHWDGRNILLDEVDERVRVISGKPVYTVDNAGGVDETVDGLILLGYHAMASRSDQLLAHTYESSLKQLFLNGVEVGEIGIEAAIAGDFGVPVVLVTGDSGGTSEAADLLDGVVTATVKESLGPTAAMCYPPGRTAAMLADAAQRAAAGAASVKPYTVSAPVELEIIFEADGFTERIRAKIADSFLLATRAILKADTVTEAWRELWLAKPPRGWDK